MLLNNTPSLYAMPTCRPGKKEILESTGTTTRSNTGTLVIIIPTHFLITTGNSRNKNKQNPNSELVHPPAF